MSSEAVPRAFTDARRFAWLRLWRSENIGPRTFETLLARFGSAESALDALPELVRRSNHGRTIRIADAADIEREMETAARLGARFLCSEEPGYPALLREIGDRPPVVAVRGRLDILDRPAIAIVGARNASAAGLAFAERLARGLAQAGYVIVSGFARGIDTAAHRAALATGTIAVLAGGHDRLYPADGEPLMAAILAGGIALSEMPFGWEARGRDFPRRNRLVSGLSLGVVVVEAARRSGSLITAGMAADQGREVFAVPGSPLDPRAEGTNDLIRGGATLCASVDDVIDALSDRMGKANGGDLFSEGGRHAAVYWDELDLAGGQPLASTRSPVRAPRPPDLFSSEDDHAASRAMPPVSPLDRVIERLGPAPVSLDELARAADLPIRAIRTCVLELELAGRIERHGGGLVSLIMP